MGQDILPHKKGTRLDSGTDAAPGRSPGRRLLRAGRGPTENKTVGPGAWEGALASSSSVHAWRNRPGAGHLGEAKHVFQGSRLPTLLGFQPEAVPATGDRCH